jgi:hypothetical protein
MELIKSSGIISIDSVIYTQYNLIIDTLQYLVIISVGYMVKQLVLVCVKHKDCVTRWIGFFDTIL